MFTVPEVVIQSGCTTVAAGVLSAGGAAIVTEQVLDEQLSVTVSVYVPAERLLFTVAVVPTTIFEEFFQL